MHEVHPHGENFSLGVPRCRRHAEDGDYALRALTMLYADACHAKNAREPM